MKKSGPVVALFLALALTSAAPALAQFDDGSWPMFRQDVGHTGHGAYHVGWADRYVYAVDHDGFELWRFLPGGGTYSSPTIDPGGTIQVTIMYYLENTSHVNLSIYDVDGRLVRTVVNTEQARNRYKVVWNGRDNRGMLTIPSGPPVSSTSSRNTIFTIMPNASVAMAR